MVPKLQLRSGQRGFVCGMTGSGKTYFVMHMFAAVPRFIVIDSKVSETIEQYGFLEPDTDDTLERVLRGEPVRVRVIDDKRAIEYFKAAMIGCDCCVYIDEVYALVPPGAKPPEEITAIWTRGRELGVSGWAATQRPTWLPLFLVSEADWLFVFRLRLEDDRKRMAAYMGEEVLQPITDEHGFYAAAASQITPFYFSGVPLHFSIAEPVKKLEEPRKQLAEAK